MKWLRSEAPQPCAPRTCNSGHWPVDKLTVLQRRKVGTGNTKLTDDKREVEIISFVKRYSTAASAVHDMKCPKSMKALRCFEKTSFSMTEAIPSSR